MQKRNMKIFFFLVLMAVSGMLTAETGKKDQYPQFRFGAATVNTMKVENSGDVSNLFDELSFRGSIEISEFTRFSALVDVGEIIYQSGFTGDSGNTVFRDDGFNRTEIHLESDVLQQAGFAPSFNLNLLAGYGSHQESLVMDFTRFRFERSSTSGIDGFNFRSTIGLGNRFFFTAAFNPVSFENLNSGGYPDVYGAFFMDNDHRGSSWGPLIHFTSSSMQLFYDSSANLKNNRLYDDLNPGKAMTLGIGGTLAMDFAGIDIFGFGMTEFFLMYNRNDFDIIQAQWGAGFKIPVLHGIEANLSGSNAITLANDGEGNYMNFGLDVQSMFTDIFGIFGAVAGIGIMDKAGVSAEAGLCLVFRHFEIYSGYSDHAIGTDAKYAKGAFDKIELNSDGTTAPGGGFFLTFKADF